MSDVQQRLQQQFADLQKEYDLRTEKLRRIRRSLVLETDPSITFKLQHDQQEEQNELKQLTTEMEQVEAQLASLSNGMNNMPASPTIPAPADAQKQNILPEQNPSQPTDYHSCFISYAHQDEPLAQRLYADLLAHGVRCWFAPHDMKIGAKIRSTIDEAIQKQDKLLLLISTHSIGSFWVEDEVEAAFEHEKRDQREMLFPIRLDENVMQSSQPWAAKLRRTRHIGDFTHWTNPQAYQQAFELLLRDLKKTEA